MLCPCLWLANILLWEESLDGSNCILGRKGIILGLTLEVRLIDEGLICVLLGLVMRAVLAWLSSADLVRRARPHSVLEDLTTETCQNLTTSRISSGMCHLLCKILLVLQFDSVLEQWFKLRASSLYFLLSVLVVLPARTVVVLLIWSKAVTWNCRTPGTWCWPSWPWVAAVGAP